MQGTKPHIIIHHTVCVTSILTLLSSRCKKRGFTMAICCLFVCSFICSCVRLSPETHAAAADVFCCCRPWPAASLLRATPPMSYMFPPRWNLWLWRGLTRGVHKGTTLVFYDISYDVTISRCLSSFQYCGNNYNCCHQASRIDWNGFGIMLLNAPGDSTLQWPAERALPYLTTLVLFCVLSYHVPCMFDRSWNNQSFWRNSYQFFIIRYTRYVFCLFHW